MCYWIKDGQGDVTFEQRPKGSKGMNYTKIWEKEHDGRREQPGQRPWGGHILDMFDKHPGYQYGWS